jgi:hypothetical protein
MKKLQHILAENMQRFNTKNLNEQSGIQSNLETDADDNAYDMILSIIERISLDLDLDTIQRAISDPKSGGDQSWDDPQHYEVITKKIIPMIKRIANDISDNVHLYNQ